MITKEELYAEFKPFFNPAGFVCRGDGLISQNDGLFHAPFVFLLHKYGLLDTEERNKQQALYDSLEHPNFPGLLRRTSNNGGGQESHDNTKARIYVSKILADGFAARWLKHGRKYGWYFDTQTPGKLGNPRANFERFTGMIAQGQIAAGEHPGIYRQLWLGAMVGSAAWGKPHDMEARMLTFLVVQTVYGFNPWVNMWSDIWKRKTMDQSKGGGLGHYWNLWWPDHPYGKHLLGVVG